ncbi:MAG: hypothetical protein ACP5MV_00015 [Candidatus Parvarchaeum sp.]
MEQKLNDLLTDKNEQAVEGLDKLKDEAPLYNLLADAAKRKGNASVIVNRKYAKLYTEDSVKYCINPKYFENENRLRRLVYSIIKNAFKEQKYSEKENTEILLNYNHQADKVLRIKTELEESYGFRGTDSGFYEVPVLGEAVEFSVKKLSVRAITLQELKEYI